MGNGWLYVNVWDGDQSSPSPRGGWRLNPRSRTTREKVGQAKEEAVGKEKKGERGKKRTDDKAFVNEIDRKPCDLEDEAVLISDLGEVTYSFPDRFRANQPSHVRVGVGLMISTTGSTQRIDLTETASAGVRPHATQLPGPRSPRPL